MSNILNLSDSILPKGIKFQMMILEAKLDAELAGQPSSASPTQPELTTAGQAEPAYADKIDYDTVLPQLIAGLTKTGVADAENKIEYSKKAGRLPVLRISDVTPAQLQKAVTGLGLTETPLTDIQSISSGQFDIRSYSGQDKIYTFVLRGVKTAASYAGAAVDLVLNRKDLTPAKLGLAKEYSDKKELADATKKAVKDKIKNENLARALTELVELAENQSSGQLSPESLEYVRPFLGMISQDFGEILAPIALANDGEEISFPVGNEKLIDVTVAGKVRYSVKALGGSGTSMNSLGSLLDEYDMTLTDEGKKKMFRDAIKIWVSTKKEGSVTDRICLAANRNQTPEYLSYVDILGGEFSSWRELKDLLKPLVKNLDYRGFLEMILPATQAGNWGSNVGMPADSNYYLGLTPNKPKPGIAGKYSYDHDPVDGAANIIAYCLGKGIEYMIKRGPSQQQYKDIMNDMIKQLNCQLGYVSIDDQGQLTITSKPFGNLDFDFDYHAPSHIAGNNRPGFMIVPPNKGDAGAKKKKTKTKSTDRSTEEPAQTSQADLDVVAGQRSAIKAAPEEPKKYGTEKTLGRKRQR
jgi:hypothetical protein